MTWNISFRTSYLYALWKDHHNKSVIVWSHTSSFFSLMMITFWDFLSWWLSNMWYSFINYSHHARFYVPVYWFYDWKLVPFDRFAPISPILQPLSSSFYFLACLIYRFCHDKLDLFLQIWPSGSVSEIKVDFTYLKIFYWTIVALQCCVIFYHTTKWISYLYTYIRSFWYFLPI